MGFIHFPKVLWKLSACCKYAEVACRCCCNCLMLKSSQVSQRELHLLEWRHSTKNVWEKFAHSICLVVSYRLPSSVFLTFRNYICLFVCMSVDACMSWYTCVGQRTACKDLILSIYHVGPGVETQGVMFGCPGLCLPRPPMVNVCVTW